MRLHTCIVSYNRPHLLLQTVESYLNTITIPHSTVIVDNGSDPDTQEVLQDLKVSAPVVVVKLERNFYPGYACNIGFKVAHPEATHLHRSDNDMEYLPGWCDEVQERFRHFRKLGQLGLRTNDEELNCDTNVGGTAVFKRELWDAGLRYRTTSWKKLGSVTEDYWISVAVKTMGWRWSRVRVPCVIHLGTGDLNDPYYRESFGVRQIGGMEGIHEW